jgi:23S rRNA (adenine2030-N6)-methyltransferase
VNYRHAYHAGNAADVFKHAVLALVIENLKRKDSAFALLDTHAGIGRYDLWTEWPNKTQEYQEGIGRLWEAPDPPSALAPYLKVVRALNGKLLRFYPGSPALAQALIRPQDRLILAELHPDDAARLKAEFGGDRRVAVHHRDGWEALKAFLPPKEKRGLALIDPPYEKPDELERLVRALAKTRERWAGGVLLAWYPVKDRPPISAFHTRLAEAIGAPTLAAELLTHPDDRPDRLNGSGLILVNPPWRVDRALAETLPWLAARLDRGGGASRLDWLVPDV